MLRRGEVLMHPFAQPPFHPICIGVLREGFLRSIQLVLQVKEGGVITAGPPCGSFIFLNMFTSGRTKWSPLGNKRGYVVEANVMFLWINMILLFQEFLCFRVQSRPKCRMPGKKHLVHDKVTKCEKTSSPWHGICEPAVCTKDNNTTMPLTLIGICSIGAYSSGATSQHIDARVPIFQMAGRHCEALHSMALNVIVLPSVFLQMFYLLSCLIVSQASLLSTFTPTWLRLWPLSSMAIFGHANMKPTVVFGDWFGPQLSTFKITLVAIC